jgi:hypothetical protein
MNAMIIDDRAFLYGPILMGGRQSLRWKTSLRFTVSQLSFLVTFHG